MSKNDYHGGSLRTIAIQKNSNLNKFNVNNLISRDRKKGIYKINFYRKMMKKIDQKKEILLKKIAYYKKQNYTVVGVGAAAKANTFLTYYGLNNMVIKFLTDSSKFKKGKLTPVTRIIIKDDQKIASYKKIACIILSWNISNLIIKKIKKLNKKAKFIFT